MLTAKYVGLGLLAVRLLQLAYLIPDSLGGQRTSLGGVGISLAVVTMLNLVAAIVLAVLGLSRQVDRSGLFDRLAGVVGQVFALLGVGWKAVLAAAGIAGLSAAVYGMINLPTALHENNGRFYHRADGKLLEITAGQYASAVHPALLFAAGILVILQVGAFCLTLVALDQYIHRTWREAEFAG